MTNWKSKLTEVVKNEVVRKSECDGKIKDIEDKIPNVTNLATNTTLNAKINDVKVEIPSTINLAKTAALNAKTNEVKGEISSITNLATTTALAAVENKMPNVSILVKKTSYNTEINEIVKKLLIAIMINILLLKNLIS